MKKFVLILFLVFFSAVLSSCGETEDNKITSSSNPLSTETETVAVTQAEATEQTITEGTNPSNTTTEAQSETETEKKTITYYSDNPNNKYIKMIENRYSVNAENLVALIRTNTDHPGATVLEFNGEKDSQGQLMKTDDKLVAVYEINRADGTIKKATGEMKGNIGYNYFESLAVFKLTKKFIIPSLPDMKENRPYKD